LSKKSAPIITDRKTEQFTFLEKYFTRNILNKSVLFTNHPFELGIGQFIKLISSIFNQNVAACT
jgi:hypothetical protein